MEKHVLNRKQRAQVKAIAKEHFDKAASRKGNTVFSVDGKKFGTAGYVAYLNAKWSPSTLGFPLTEYQVLKSLNGIRQERSSASGGSLLGLAKNLRDAAGAGRSMKGVEARVAKLEKKVDRLIKALGGI